MILSASTFIVFVVTTATSEALQVTTWCQHGPSGWNRLIFWTGVTNSESHDWSLFLVLLLLFIALPVFELFLAPMSISSSLLLFLSQIVKMVNTFSLFAPTVEVFSNAPRTYGDSGVLTMTTLPADMAFTAAGWDKVTTWRGREKKLHK